MMKRLCPGFVVVVVSALALSCSQPPAEVGFQMPERIVDLSPVIDQGSPMEWWGHKTLSDFAFPDSAEFTDFIVDTPPLYFKNSIVALMDHVGPHADSPGQAIKGTEEIEFVPLEKLFGPAALIY